MLAARLTLVLLAWLHFPVLLTSSCGNGQHVDTAHSLNQSGEESASLFRLYHNGKFGFINSKGKVVVEAKYDDVQDYSEGLALVTLNRQKLFIDTRGKVALQPENFEPINGFQDGLARGDITSKPGIKGYIDKTGRIIIENEKYGGAYEFYEGLAVVSKRGMLGYMDKLGHVVIEPQFVEASPFREGLAAVQWGDRKNYASKWGFIDKTGLIVIKPQFDLVGWFSEGLATVAVKSNGEYSRWGFIDKTGRVIIKPQFAWANQFSEGLAAIQIGRQFGYVNAAGDVVIKSQFDKAQEFSEGLAAVAISGKWGFIDKSGQFIIEPRFNEAEAFRDGLAFVKVGGYDANYINDVVGGIDTTGSWGYIDKTGKYIWQPSK